MRGGGRNAPTYKLINDDCLFILKQVEDCSVDMVLTDIPYDGINSHESNGLRKLTKEKADVITFDLNEFLEEICRVTKSSIVIFCASNQVSQIFSFFKEKQLKHKGTVRQLIWEKTNPSPMNGKHIYLSGIENAVWFKKRGGVFNAHCKNTVFKHPCGRSKLHPTEKNHELLKELILDNTNVGDIILDPCAGSGSHLLVSNKLNRNAIGIELDTNYFNIAKQRMEEFNEQRQ